MSKDEANFDNIDLVDKIIIQEIEIKPDVYSADAVLYSQEHRKCFFHVLQIKIPKELNKEVSAKKLMRRWFNMRRAFYKADKSNNFNYYLYDHLKFLKQHLKHSKTSTFKRVSLSRQKQVYIYRTNRTNRKIV